MKKLISSLLKSILPLKVYKLIANGFIIVPKYYKGIIDDAEKYFDICLEDSDDKAMLLMRKYAHIIDKGLHRHDATPGHSKSCYLLLKKTLDRLAATEYAQDPTYQWALSKKIAYENLQEHPDDFQPLHGDPPRLTIDFDDFFQLVKSRRSNRQFHTQIVEQETIGKLKDVANWASSSCNKQPIELFTTNDPQTAKACLKCCKGGTGFGDFIPSFWVFTANIRGYIFPTEIFLPAVDVSLGAQNVMLGATALGLSGTILS